MKWNLAIKNILWYDWETFQSKETWILWSADLSQHVTMNITTNYSSLRSGDYWCNRQRDLPQQWTRV